MKHRKIGKKFNISRSHYKSMFKNMLNSLIDKEIIQTTLEKAKELRKIAEKIITLSKNNNISNRRLVFSKVRNKNILFKLFKNIGPRFFKREGGYTRIIKSKYRLGDNASMAYIELLDRIVK